MANADGKMRIEKIVNNNKNKKPPNLDTQIGPLKYVYNVVRTTTTKKD